MLTLAKNAKVKLQLLLVLKRCQIGQMVQWEDENSDNLNIVQFALNSAIKHCFGFSRAISQAGSWSIHLEPVMGRAHLPEDPQPRPRPCRWPTQAKLAGTSGFFVQLDELYKMVSMASGWVYYKWRKLTRTFARRCSPLTTFWLYVSRSVLGSILGAWLGAVVIPLDWDQWWQAWTLCSHFGSLFGVLLAVLSAYFRIWTKPPFARPKKR
ncbi:hypothetical protein niasHS_004961 [Heterodera schachtii]|uniref:Uncharacterized protein n=1 Tax=Heterodera schachtii TaxID=97005 RepID=A0ABD2JR34_HETSC